MSRACQEVQESIYLLDDGELDAQEQSHAERHLATCEDCQELLREVRALRAGLAALTSEEAPEGFRERTLSRMSDGPSWDSGASRPWSAWVRWSSLAAAAGLICTTAWFAWQDGEAPPPATRRVAEKNREVEGESNEPEQLAERAMSQLKYGKQGSLTAPAQQEVDDPSLQALVDATRQGQQQRDAVPAEETQPLRKRAEGRAKEASFRWQIPTDQVSTLVDALGVVPGGFGRLGPSTIGPSTPGPASKSPLAGGRDGRPRSVGQEDPQAGASRENAERARRSMRGGGGAKKESQDLEVEAVEESEDRKVAPRRLDSESPQGWREVLAQVAAVTGQDDQVRLVMSVADPAQELSLPLDLAAVRMILGRDPRGGLASEDKMAVQPERLRRDPVEDQEPEAAVEQVRVTLRQVTLDEWRRHPASKDGKAVPETPGAGGQRPAGRLWLLVIEAGPERRPRSTEDG